MKYEIKGGSFPVVVCNVEAEQSVRCQRGAMAWMTDNMEMSTKGGGLGKIAINYGYYRYKYLVMLIAVILLIAIVQIFQSIGRSRVASFIATLRSGICQSIIYTWNSSAQSKASFARITASLP